MPSGSTEWREAVAAACTVDAEVESLLASGAMSTNSFEKCSELDVDSQHVNTVVCSFIVARHDNIEKIKILFQTIFYY